MTKLLGLTVLAACATSPTPQVDAVAFRDLTCSSPDSDCIELVPPRTSVALPTDAFELIVHSDGELGDVIVTAAGVPIAPIATTRDTSPGGTDITLVVDPLPDGPITVSSGDATFTFDNGRKSPDYGSTYSSNCTCTFCTVYCSVNGQTTKGGTCC